MSDAFQAGIGAAQNAQAQLAQRATLTAEIYSQILRQNAQLEQERVRALAQLEERKIQEDGLLKRLQVQETGDTDRTLLRETGATERERLQQEGLTQRDYIDKQTQIILKDMDLQSAFELEEYKQGQETARFQWGKEYDADVQARQRVWDAERKAEELRFKSDDDLRQILFQRGYSAEQVEAYINARRSTDPAARGILHDLGPDPTIQGASQRAREKAQQQAAGAGDKRLRQTSYAMQQATYFGKVRGDIEATMFGDKINPTDMGYVDRTGEQQRAADIQAWLDQVAKGEMDQADFEAKYQERIKGSYWSGDQWTKWRQVGLIEAQHRANAYRGIAEGVENMPPQNLQQFHNAQPPEVRKAVDDTAGRVLKSATLRDESGNPMPVRVENPRFKDKPAPPAPRPFQTPTTPPAGPQTPIFLNSSPPSAPHRSASPVQNGFFTVAGGGSIFTTPGAETGLEQFTNTWITPKSVQRLTDKVAGAVTGASKQTLDSLDYDAAYRLTYRQIHQGAYPDDKSQWEPTKEQGEGFGKLPYRQKVALLRRMAEYSADPDSPAARVVGAFDDANLSISSVLFGYTGDITQLPFDQGSGDKFSQGDFGLVGDAGVYYLGGKVLGGALKAGGKFVGWAYGNTLGRTAVGKAWEEAGRAAATNAANTITTYATRYAPNLVRLVGGKTDSKSVLEADPNEVTTAALRGTQKLFPGRAATQHLNPRSGSTVPLDEPLILPPSTRALAPQGSPATTPLLPGTSATRHLAPDSNATTPLFIPGGRDIAAKWREAIPKDLRLGPSLDPAATPPTPKAVPVSAPRPFRPPAPLPPPTHPAVAPVGGSIFDAVPGIAKMVVPGPMGDVLRATPQQAIDEVMNVVKRFGAR